jgi:hypothetical protein
VNSDLLVDIVKANIIYKKGTNFIKGNFLLDGFPRN